MKKALLIGINYINSNIKLNGCIDDIVNMNTVLKDIYNYDSVIMLRDDISNPATMPTKQNILSALNNLIKDSANCTEIWIHYSGHGARVQDKNGDESSGYDSVLVPVDYNTTGFIVDDDLYKIINKSKCKTIILVDSCNSGTVIDLPWSFNYMNPSKYSLSLNNRSFLNNQQVYMISGCKDNQTSADTYSTVEKKSVGAFTYSFLVCLKHMNYKCSLLLLYRLVCMYLKQSGFTQIPVFSSSTNNPNATTAILSLPITTKQVVSTLIVSPNSNTKSMNTVTKNISMTIL